MDVERRVDAALDTRVEATASSSRPCDRSKRLANDACRSGAARADQTRSPETQLKKAAKVRSEIVRTRSRLRDNLARASLRNRRL